MSRGFDITEVRTDQGSELAAMKPALDALGSPLEVAGPGQHVGVAERAIRVVEERVRPTLCHGQHQPLTPGLVVATTSARTKSSRA